MLTSSPKTFGVLIGVYADGTSIPMLCERSKDSPSANDVLYYLHIKFGLDTVVQAGNSLLQKDVLDLLPEQMEIGGDLHLRPYYGDEDETDGLYHSEARAGTAVFHAYATLYARVHNKRFTLAVSAVSRAATPPARSLQSSSAS